MWSKGRGSFDTEVYIYISHIYTEVFNCGLVLIRLYMHIYMYVWTYLHVGSFGTEVYILGIYMEVFSLQLRDHIFISAYI